MPSFSSPTVLTDEHDLSGFECGEDVLDEFLKNHALARQTAMLSRTYVVTSGGLAVVGYYTLAHVMVSQAESPKKIGRGMPSLIPAMLLARLAVDRRCQGHGLGASLFQDALLRTWSVMRDGSAPVRLFVVDALNENVAAFYDRLDMIHSPSNPLRLFLHYKDLRGMFEE